MKTGFCGNPKRLFDLSEQSYLIKFKSFHDQITLCGWFRVRIHKETWVIKIWISQWEHRLHRKEPIALSVTYTFDLRCFMNTGPGIELITTWLSYPPLPMKFSWFDMFTALLQKWKWKRTSNRWDCKYLFY